MDRRKFFAYVAAAAGGLTGLLTGQSRKKPYAKPELTELGRTPYFPLQSKPGYVLISEEHARAVMRRKGQAVPEWLWVLPDDGRDAMPYEQWRVHELVQELTRLSNDIHRQTVGVRQVYRPRQRHSPWRDPWAGARSKAQ